MSTDIHRQCLACSHPLSEEQAKNTSYFGFYPWEEMPQADDLMEYYEHHARLISAAGSLFHAVYLLAETEVQENDPPDLKEHVEPLAMLGQFLCYEIAQAGERLKNVGRRWEKRAPQACRKEGK